jgi:hypothetical protein
MSNYVKPNRLIRFGTEKTIFLLLFYSFLDEQMAHSFLNNKEINAVSIWS